MIQRELTCKRCGKTFVQILEGAGAPRKYCDDCRHEILLERYKKKRETEKYKEYMRSYYKTHAEKFRAANRRHQAKKYREEKLKAFRKAWKSENVDD